MARFRGQVVAAGSNRARSDASRARPLRLRWK